MPNANEPKMLCARRDGHPRRGPLLAGVSALALLIYALPAEARCIGNCTSAGAAASASVAAAASAVTTAQQAAAATQQSMNSLIQATRAVEAMQAAQTAAHNLALSAPSTVPDGLATGGLVPDSGLAGSGIANPVSTWTGANTPTETTGNGQTLVTIVQTQQKAILNWSSFNVGTNTEVYFNQSAGNSSTGNGWIALNRVTDPTGNPAQILGQISAQGSVYIIDGNGILFGGSSQINVNSLIASSLNLFSNDLATSNNRFLTGGIGDLNSTNFSTDSILLTTTTPNVGNITIAPGASITLGTSGLAVIAAPNVTNSGTITAPSGQVALIAGIGVSYDYNYSSFNPYGGGSSGQPQGYNDDTTTNLRFANYGQLLDANGNDITPVGTLTNNGLIYTPRGNITLLGGDVQQDGVAVATTSTQQPGSIVVESLYEVGANGALNPADEYDTTFYTGAISFGPNAVTAILPDTNGVTIASDATSLAPFQSQPGPATFITPLPTQGFGIIEIIGQAIDFQGGMLAYAPGQTISASAVVLPDPRTGVPPVPGSGGILLGNGAVIDVSGVPDTELPASYNFLTVSLGGNELADSPLQQDDFLYSASVTVDMQLTGTNAETGESWVGTPLANLSSYLNLVQQSIGQLLVNGGTASFAANQFVGAPGSIINIMGGYLQYLPGAVRTTEVVASNGRIYNIGDADPDLTYVGIAGEFTVDHNQGGVLDAALTQIYTNPLIGAGQYQQDYIQGGNGGTLNIAISEDGGVSNSTAIVANSGAIVLDSTLLAGTVTGMQQVMTGALPNNGAFDFSGTLPIEIGDPAVFTPAALAASSMPAGFDMTSPLLASAGSSYATANVFNDQTLNAGNFGTITLVAVGPGSSAITEDAGASVTVQPGGTISLTGGNVTINGALTARAGTIDITTNPIAEAFTNDNVPGNIVVGSAAVLDVSGLFLNDSAPSAVQWGATRLINGGSISLIADEGVIVDLNTGAHLADLTGDITLAAGSLLDLEGGGLVLPGGKLDTVSSGAPAGTGGNLTLKAYAGIDSPPFSGTLPTQGYLTIDGTIDALGFSGGGTLTLQTVALQVGGEAAITPAYAFYFDPAVWGSLGFGSFNLSSVLQTEVPANAIVRLTHQNLLPNLVEIASAPTDADPAANSTVGFLTGTWLSPTNLSINAGLETISNGNAAFAPAGSDYAQVDSGAEIIADPGATISIASEVMTAIEGTIRAPGGTISIAVDAPNFMITGVPQGPLYLGPQSVLDVSGTTVINPQPTPVNTLGGLVIPYTGSILAGGTINLNGGYSPILVAPGAVIDVSGAAGAFDVAQLASRPLDGTAEVLSRQPVWSNAGQVNISDASGLLFEGSLVGEPGAPQATGATLQITGGTVSESGVNFGIDLVEDTAAAISGIDASFDLATYIPTPILTGVPLLSSNLPSATLLFGTDSLNGSGFSSLILTTQGNVSFAGQVSLTLNNSFIVTASNYTAGNISNPGFALAAGAMPTNGASLSVTAAYIELTGPTINDTIPEEGGANFAGDATLSLNATGALDLAGFTFFNDINQATFSSNGDIQLLPIAYAPAAGTQLLGYLQSAGNLTFAAADIYPATDTAFVIQSSSPTGLPTTITFAYPSGIGPSQATPLSAGGTVLVDAATIVQGGEIQAPFGSIILGINASSLTVPTIASALGGFNPLLYAPTINTQSVTLGGGSITSVSANGATIPFGSTVDQTTWIYNPHLNNPSWNDGNQQVAFSEPVTEAPQGVVTLAGSSIAFESGATINLDGGGNLQAQEWIPGTGGSRNLLTQYQTSYQNSTTGQQVPTYPDAREIFAIVPGYSGAVAPYDANLSQVGLTAGEAIYLSGGNGLPAGVYTLLPAQYATLPGAYRVVVNSGITNPLQNQTVVLPDGTMEMTGYVTSNLTGSRPSSTQQFFVQSAAVWGRYSQYVLTDADTFFPAYAAANGLATPVVPADAGRLVIAASTDLILNGTLKGAAGPGGFGAQLDISGQNLAIVDSGSGTSLINNGVVTFSSSNPSNLIPNGTTVSFTNSVSGGDVFTFTGSGTLVVPVGDTVAQLVSAGGNVTLTSQSLSLPAGDTLAVVGTGSLAVQAGGGDTVTLASNETLTLPASSMTLVTMSVPSSTFLSRDTLTYSSAGQEVTVTSPNEFTVGGVAATQDPVTGLFEMTYTSASQKVVGTVVGQQQYTWTVAGSGAGGTLVYVGIGRATATLATTGSATYQLSSGVSVAALSSSDQLTGTYTLSGGATLDVTLPAGTYAVTSGQQFSNFSAAGPSSPITFTANAADAIAYSGSGTDALPTSLTYLDLSAQQLDALGATSLLIGGTRSFTPAGMVITPTANSINVANDASAPLTAPEIMLVADPQFTTMTVQLDTEGDTATVSVPVAGTGQILIQSGSVLEAQGNVGVGEPSTLILGSTLPNLPIVPNTALVSALEDVENGPVIQTLLANYYQEVDTELGTLVRLTNVSGVQSVQVNASALNPGAITVTDNVNLNNSTYTAILPSLAGGTGLTVQSGAQLLGGNGLDLASTGDVQVQSGALLSGTNIFANSSQITFVGSGTPPANGAVISGASLQLQNAETINLQSSGLIAFEGNVTLDMGGGGGQGSLTLGGGAFSSDGGQVSISAPTLVLDNELNATVPAFVTGSGTLSINAGELIFGTGAKTLQGFGSVSIVASQGVVGQGSGSMDFGSLPLTLQTPIMIADGASDQTITTTGALSVIPVAGGAPLALTPLGGAIALQGGSVTVSVPIEAQAGNISLAASAGDVTVTSSGALIANGAALQFLDLTEYAPGGAITLSANQGTVTIESGALLDFAGAAGGGNGGSLAINTTNSTAPIALNGTLLGATTQAYAGSNFSLNTQGAVSLDTLATILTNAGVTGSISVETADAGGLSLSQTLTAQTVSLIADNGLVSVTGTINASGAAGGTIALFGTSGVTVTGNLIATGSDPNQLGGTVEIGTGATFTSGNYNPTYGYEAFSPTDSGTITIGSSAVIDVSGGTVDGQTGGTILLRAPLLYDGTIADDGDVNVTLAPTATFRGARAVSLEAYAVWSTSDTTTGAQHFDGVIDPAGWYDSNGNLVSGTFTNANGDVVLNYTAGTMTAAQLATYLTNDYFAPTNADTAHQTFYGYVDGNSTAATPGTLMGFVESPVSSTQGFQLVANSGSIANFQETPGIELDNPTSANVNSGNILVLTNWNLGAENAGGTPVYRYSDTIAPTLTLRAGGNVLVDASITDGFVETSPISVSSLSNPISYVTYNAANSSYMSDTAAWSFSSINIGGLTPPSAVLAPDLPGMLGDAATEADGYYGTYESYLAAYQIFFNVVSEYSGQYLSGGAGPSTFATRFLTTANNDYASATTLSAYTSIYLPAYQTYLTKYQDTYANDDPGDIGALPAPPQPPPLQSITPPAGINIPDPMPTVNNLLPITSMSLAAEANSTSYRIVAGANFASADPLAIVLGGTGDVTLNDNAAYSVDGESGVVPTTVRTGTGSIDIAAAGNFELLDTTAPGVVYTAGMANQAPPAGYVPDLMSQGWLLTSAEYPVAGGGDISISAGGNIVGIENVNPTGTNFLGQFWDPWLLTSPNSPGFAWYVNFGSFDQGIMSIGGNVSVAAGGSISDLAVSLPTVGYFDADNTFQHAGGGNLAVNASGSIYSGDFYVGQGSGVINAGDAIAPDFVFAETYPVATMLAVQYGTIAVEARQSVNIGSVVDPTYLWTPGIFPSSVTTSPVSATVNAVLSNLIPYVTSMSADSGVSVQATSGSVTFNSLLVQGALFDYGTTAGLPNSTGNASISSLLLPASLGLVALEGGIDIDYGGGLYPSTTGTLSVIADQSINLAIPLITSTGIDGSIAPDFATLGNVFGTTLGKLDYPVGTGILPTASAPALVPVWDLLPTQTNDPSLIATVQSDPVYIYALNGNIDDGVQLTAVDGVFNKTRYTNSGPVDTAVQTVLGSTVDQISLTPSAPAQIYAGQDVVDLPFFGMNFTASDITSIIARGNIRYNVEGDEQSPAIELAGPGMLDVIAGGNISFESQRVAGVTETGIRTIGNSIDETALPILETAAPSTDTTAPYNTTTFLAYFGNPYLPTGGASVNVLFGVSPGMTAANPGMNIAGFIAAYVNPVTSGATGAGYANDLIAFVTQYETSNGMPVSGSLTPAQAWTIFETLPADQQQLLVEEVFFDILNTTGLNYNKPSSPGYQQYSTGYQAINTLFPASYGYTANSLGTVNGGQPVQTGNLDLRGSTIQTQQGGNISILGPGGEILVGSAVAAPAVDPGSEGILTIESGNIDIFTDQSVLVAQSRIMTEQGGNIVMWSSNGNIDAGEGAKTSVSQPPPLYTCDLDFYCTADIKGQVSGAGIATLQSLPGVPVGNANLMAPRGTINAGAAGIRVSGNLNIVALQVINTFNIQVQGTTIGIPTATAPGIGALTTASNTAGAVQAAVPAPSNQNNNQASIITVEFLGFGGGGDEYENEPDDNNRRKTPKQRSDAKPIYNPNGPVRILGVGSLTDEEKQSLSTAEKDKL